MATSAVEKPATEGTSVDWLPVMGEVKHIDVDGLPVRYIDSGEGAPMVLVHGWIGSGENFHKWMPALEGRRRLVIPDLPGFGETPALAGRHDVAALARTLDGFVKALDMPLFDLGGLCLGATVAIELARQDPARVRQLVLHTPIYSRHAISPQFKVQAALCLNRVVFGVGSRLARSRFISDLYKRFFVEGPDVDPVDARINFENQLRCSPRAAREWVHSALHQELGDWLRSWEQPVLMVVAADDWLLDHQRMQLLTESMQTAEVVVIPDAGHGWTEALVKAQAAAISGFLAREPI